MEVCIAAAVLGLTVASSLVAMQMGFAMIETARDNTLASQILQSEMEDLRLLSWDSLVDLDEGEFPLEGTFHESVAGRFTCSRVFTSPRAGMRQVTLKADWSSNNGVARSREYTTFFSKEGLNDYYYRSLR